MTRKKSVFTRFKALERNSSTSQRRLKGLWEQLTESQQGDMAAIWNERTLNAWEWRECCTGEE